MAGIGFELKKLFSRRGLFASFRAYGYAGIICTGPMLLGIVLLLGVMFLCDRTGASKQSRELLVCMITYTLLASLTVTSFLSMVVTRFIADMLYEEKNEAVLSSFWGSTGLMLIAGGILYGIFLIFSGVGLIDKFLCFELFGELIVTWNAMSYLTAIKDYRGIMLSFLAAIAVTFLSGALLLFLGISHVEALMAAVCIGYGIMLLWDVVLLYEYFPQSDISAFLFLRWADEFLPLAFTGLCINIGLFAHLVIMWAGPLGKQVKGLFYGAPSHDVPALIAFLTILITTVNFVVSVEVNFYPKYRNYYSLFNDGGTIKDIMQAGTEMLDVLNRELKYTALKQLLTTALAISMGESLLKYLPLGFNDLMYGYFRTLCVGYGIYAVANTMLLLLLYFTDYRGALVARYGNLFPYLIAMVVGLLVGELDAPGLEIGTFIKIPQFKDIIDQVSIFGVGIPSASMFIKALPLALVCYVIAFGDFVTTETLVSEARQARDDEYIDFNSSRSNLVSGLRNLILSIIAPFPPLSGPLWVGMTVSVSMRYKEGKKAMKSLLGGMASFRLATFLSVLIIPVVSFFRPIFGVGSSITLMFQAFVCARIGMDYCKSDRDKMIAGVMAAVLATQGTAWASAWALAVGFGLNIFLSNWNPLEKNHR